MTHNNTCNEKNKTTDAKKQTPHNVTNKKKNRLKTKWMKKVKKVENNLVLQNVKWYIVQSYLLAYISHIMETLLEISK